MKLLRTLLVPVVVAAAVLVVPMTAHAATVVRPGDQLSSDSGQCTANFVYTDSSANTYIGLAAHCFSTGTNTDTNGCTTGSLPLGAAVTNSGGTVIGTLAYSSWLLMQSRHETDSETCAYNDLSLVKLASGVSASPSVPTWGGPTGTAAAGAPEAGKTIYTYGNSSLRQGITTLSPKTGTGVSDSPGGWSHTVRTTNPGIPGDSGSGFLDSQGRAFGVLSTLGVGIPDGVSNGVGDLPKELAYASANGSLGTISVVNGGSFNPSAGLTGTLGLL